MHLVQLSLFISPSDVEYPSVCYEYVLLPLLKKEVALAYGRTEYSLVKKLN